MAKFSNDIRLSKAYDHANREKGKRKIGAESTPAARKNLLDAAVYQELSHTDIAELARSFSHEGEDANDLAHRVEAELEIIGSFYEGLNAQLVSNLYRASEGRIADHLVMIVNGHVRDIEGNVIYNLRADPALQQDGKYSPQKAFDAYNDAIFDGDSRRAEFMRTVFGIDEKPLEPSLQYGSPSFVQDVDLKHKRQLGRLFSERAVRPFDVTSIDGLLQVVKGKPRSIMPGMDYEAGSHDYEHSASRTDR